MKAKTVSEKVFYLVHKCKFKTFISKLSRNKNESKRMTLHKP